MSKKPKAKGASGRPRMCATAEELQERVDDYFSRYKAKPTISGLAGHIGYLDRKSIYDVLGQKDAYSDIIKSAINKIESKIESMLFRAAPTAGVIFWMKCHGNAKEGMGMWKDTSRVDVTSGGDKIQQSTVVVSSPSVAEAIKEAIKELDG